ncbi:hypothetical protein [Nitrosospira sp. NRS527]|uniref:hypothetical protein n=1 Tax=Nitrosospira sp. NRS527 TaxID=155925 RepID=UPI001BCA7242|nr:hypothetical protein [Nitrosospira sp. NRS527]
MVVVMDVFVYAGRRHAPITYNEIFDLVCERFSDHFRASVARAAKDMSPETCANCRRDLVIQGIDVNDLWKLAVQRKVANPLFQARLKQMGFKKGIQAICDPTSDMVVKFEKLLRADEAYLRPRRAGIQLLPVSVPVPPQRTRQEVCNDVPYNVVMMGARSEELIRRQEEVRLVFRIDLFREDFLHAQDQERQVADELETIYHINASLSKAEIPIKNKTTTTTHKNTPDGETGDVTMRSKRRTTIWSARDREVYYRSIEEGLLHGKTCPLLLDGKDLKRKLERCQGHLPRFNKWLASHARSEVHVKLPATPEEFLTVDLATRPWRKRVYALLEEYDLARLHQAKFQSVYDAASGLGSECEIHSGFSKLINRRYQALHFWPSYITSRGRDQFLSEDASSSEQYQEPTAEDTIEGVYESYRKRWFKTKDSANGKTRDLVGFDISASQMQILAIFLGDKNLEALAMGPDDGQSFKERMARRAWHLHRDPDCAMKLQTESVVESYVVTPESCDDRLQNLVKELIMQVSYGSTARTVEKKQAMRPNEFGPGWKEGSARLFLQNFYRECRTLRRFRSACRRLAKLAYEQPSRTIELTDPFDNASVCWNPVARRDVWLPNAGQKLMVSLPAGLSRLKGEKAPGAANQSGAGENVITFEEKIKSLRTSTDVKKLKRMTAPCLVQMLDSYYSSLVMEELVERKVNVFVGIHDCWLVPKGTEKKLRESMDAAADKWFRGLGLVYDDLLRYMDSDSQFGGFFRRARRLWAKRCSEDFRLQFRAQPVPKKIAHSARLDVRSTEEAEESVGRLSGDPPDQQQEQL